MRDVVVDGQAVLVHPHRAAARVDPLRLLLHRQVVERRHALLHVAQKREPVQHGPLRHLVELLDELAELDVGQQGVRPLGVLAHQPSQVARLVALPLELDLREGLVDGDEAFLVVEQQVVRKLGRLPLRTPY